MSLPRCSAAAGRAPTATCRWWPGRGRAVPAGDLPRGLGRRGAAGPAGVVDPPGQAVRRLRRHPRRRRVAGRARAPAGWPPCRSAAGSPSPDRSAGRSRCPRTRPAACSWRGVRRRSAVPARRAAARARLPGHARRRRRRRGPPAQRARGAPVRAASSRWSPPTAASASAAPLPPLRSAPWSTPTSSTPPDRCRCWRASPSPPSAHGVRSQLALERPLTCATGLCQGCPVPVVGDDGSDHVVRACVDGPVFRGDRVRWEELA